MFTKKCPDPSNHDPIEPLPVYMLIAESFMIGAVLFCVYVDDLLCMLAKSNVGCYIGTYFWALLPMPMTYC